MDQDKAGYLARDLMDDHGLALWSFAFDNAKRRCGACFNSKRKITLSRHYVALNDEWDVRDTILHEIAHAIAGYKAGHGPKWQAEARRIGATPKRCADASVEMPKAPWKLVCATGHVVGTRHRRNRNMAHYGCGKCRSPLRYVPNT